MLKKYALLLSLVISSLMGVSLSADLAVSIQSGGAVVNNFVSAGSFTASNNFIVSLYYYDPAASDSYQIIDASSISGQFDDVILPTLNAGLTWNLSNLYTTGVIRVDSTGLSVNPVVWLDARDRGSLYLESDDTVSTWFDKSGNNYHFVQAASSQRPAYNSSGLNSLPTLTFDGSDDNIQYSNPVNMQTIIIVNTPRTDSVLEGIIGELNMDKGIRRYNTYPNFENYWVNGASVGDANDFSYSGGHLYVNGSETNYAPNNAAHVLAVTRGAGHGYSYQAVTVGGYYPTRYYNGDISEVLIFDSILSSSDLTAVSNLLSQKYGMSFTMNVELTGDNQFNNGTHYDNGVVATGSVLNVSLSSYAPSGGDSFKIITANSIGQLSNITLPALNDGLKWDLSSLYTDGIIAVESTGLSVNPILWLNGDDSGSISIESSAIQAWFDLTGQNHHATQGSASYRPTLSTNALNGHNGIAFSNDYLSIDPSINDASFLPFTFIAVTQGTTRPKGLFDSAPGLENPFRFFSAASNDYSIELWERSPYLNLTLDSDGSAIVATGNLSGSRSLSLQLNNNTMTSGSGNSNQVPLTNPVIGCINLTPATMDFNGKVLEIIIFDSLLSAADMAVMKRYIGSKYNLATGYSVNITASNTNELIDLGGAQIPTESSLIINKNGYEPVEGDVFSIFNGHGNVSKVNLPTLNSGLEWNLSRLDTDGEIGVSSSIVNVSEASLKFWFDANTSSTIYNGAVGVARWMDRSGANNHAERTNNDSLQAPLVSNAFSDKSALYFSGNKDYILPDSAIPVGNTSYTAFAVIDTRSSGDNLFIGAGSGTDYHAFRLAVPGGKIADGWWVGDVFAYRKLKANGSMAVWRYDTSTGRELYSDGILDKVQSGNEAATNRNGSFTSGSARLGYGYWIANGYYNGYVAEVIMYEGAVSSSNRRAIQQYLGLKYSVPFELTADISPGSISKFSQSTQVIPTHSVLTVSLNGETPELGDNYDVVDAARITPFAQVNLPELEGGLAWDLSQLLTTGVISVINAPGRLDISPTVWLTASDIGSIGMTTANKVFAWHDKTGGNGSVEQSNSSYYIDYTSANSDANNQASLMCNNGGLQDYEVQTRDIFSTQNATIFAVFKQNNPDSSELFNYQGSSSSRVKVHTAYINGNTYFDYGNGLSNGRIETTTPYSSGQWNLSHYVKGASSGYAYSDRNVYMQNLSFTSDFDYGQTYTTYIGTGSALGSSSFDGELAELIIYDQTLSQRQQDRVLNYLSGKYATLPVLINMDLTADTVVSGSIVTESIPTNSQVTVNLTYTPSNGDVFNIGLSASAIRPLDRLDLPMLPTGSFWDLSNLHTNGTIAVTANHLSMIPVQWYDATDSGAISNMSGVYRLFDKSGHNRHGLQATTANRASIVQSAINGRSAMNFDGSDDQLVIDQVISGTQARTIAIVYATDNTGPLMTLSVGAQSAGKYYTIRSDGSVYDGATVQNYNRRGLDDVFAYNVVIMSNGSSENFNQIVEYLNGFRLTDLNTSSSAAINTSSGTAYIGRSHSNQLTGKVAEVMIFDYQLKEPEVKELMGYFKRKYNINIIENNPNLMMW